MTNLFSVAIGVLFAGVLSYLGNRHLYQVMGTRGIVVGVPVWEESCKALVVLLLPGHPVVLVHLFFGILECALSLASNSKSGKALGLVALVTHVLTGALVVTVIDAGSSLWLAYLLAIGLHFGLNAGVVRFLLPNLVWGEHRQEG